jgi:hypothetical protein
VICGKEFLQPKSRNERNRNNYCSLQCKAKKAEDLCGDSWKGGETSRWEGYKMVACDRVSYAAKGRKTKLIYRAEYRLKVEEAIGRRLATDEMVFHINRDKTDHRLENLYVFRSFDELRRARGRGYPTRSNIDELAAEAAVLQ